MKSLNVYLESIIDSDDVYLESLLDDEDNFYGANSDKKMVESWIRDNYKINAWASVITQGFIFFLLYKGGFFDALLK